MNQLPSIPQDPQLELTEDFFELRRKGIGFIEQMGSRWWTDYNLHDPGITILEALCYAITDLAYRTGWDIKDLLTLKDGKIAKKQPFFTAREILTINPLTTNDYRKLLIDAEGVRNAWVLCKQCACDVPIYTWCQYNGLHWGYQKPDTKDPSITILPEIKPSGLYEVLLSLDDGADEALLIEKVEAILQSHRNLGEDFCHISVVPMEEIAVCADVEVAPDADLERVQAEIWWQIEQYLNPAVPFYALQELKDDKIPTEEIFNGPALEHGFIKTTDLEKSELRREIRTSDLINLLADIEGVQAVNSLLISKYDETGQPIKGAADGGQNKNQLSAYWTMAVSAGHQPELNRNISRFLFYKNGLPFLPHTQEANDLLTQLRRGATHQKDPKNKGDLPIPTGNYRNVLDYYPVQYSLPMNYGVGEAGLPSHASDQRRAQAKQLKAYLLLFEQLLLNAHAQVAQVGDLFSLTPTKNQTYFSEFIDENLIVGSDDLFKNWNSTELQKLMESDDNRLERRNRFLDHLLARFGENLQEHALFLHTDAQQKIDITSVTQSKIEFLREQDQLGYDRAKSFDYKQNTGVSGLQMRIQKLLGTTLTSKAGDDVFFVIEHLLLRPKFPGDALFEPCTDAGCDDCGPNDPYSFRLTFVMPGGEGAFNTDLELRRFAERSIRHETPSHLLPKICWIGNEGFDYDYDPKNPNSQQSLIISQIADVIDEDDPQKACACAEKVFKHYQGIFKEWIDEKKHLLFLEKEAEQDLIKLFNVKVDFSKIKCVSENVKEVVKATLLAYFVRITRYGLQFDRLKAAWENWRKENAKIDWTNLQLQQQVEDMLRANLKSNASADVCACTKAILANYGQQFYEKMKAKIENNIIPDSTILNMLAVKVECNTTDFSQDPTLEIETFLKTEYSKWIEVSYRLWLLLKTMEKLENAYPTATLHDCDDGNDDNPVRLDSTALGGN